MQSPPSIEHWNQRFAIPGIARIAEGNGGLPKLVLTTGAAAAEIYLHGAQIVSWQPAGSAEILFLSEHSHWEPGRAIRGGIPVCFPWFRAKADDLKAPAHGLVRTKAWDLEAITQQQDRVTVTLATASDDETRRWWRHEFRLVHRITIGAALQLELETANTGPAPFRFEEALHTYFHVGDIEQVRITGLDATAFLDNTDQNRRRMQHGDVAIAAPTDNAYLDTRTSPELVDPVLQRRLRTEKAHSLTTIVWNPWAQGAAALADLGNDEWRHMACVEASNILDAAVTLPPGASHTMSATITVTE